jgi:EAL and modified HD-GYP domain-containing signal transduction protein
MPSLAEATPDSAPTADTVLAAFTHYVGRQPILDASQQLFGYELLFRTGLDNCFSGDPEQATRQMIDNVLLFGLETLTPHAKAFINCTREALVDRLVTSLPVELTVLEIVESITVDDAVVEACTDLKKMGYGIALDDFLPDRGADRLLPLADYIKLDFRACSPLELRRIHQSLQGVKAHFIAEKVETEEEFKQALADGFQLFQGYFFSRPTILQQREIPPSHMLYVQLLSAISQSPWNHREVERLVMAEASLCFRVLRLVNSPALAIRGQITSIRQALLMIGEDEFRKLVCVASATSFGKRFNMSSELILLALHRARFCELIAPIAHQIQGEQYLIGLLSAFDAILQIPTAQILELLPLRPDAAGVLLGHDTPAALPFQLLHCYEQRQWVRCARFCHKLHISEAELTSLYLNALQWATKEIRDAGM